MSFEKYSKITHAAKKEGYDIPVCPQEAPGSFKGQNQGIYSLREIGACNGE